ncbi:MAG: hypothetical protein ACI82A_003572 [Candidatus Azotimanducaceae bacterium]|jgi:hypothetical protein
MNASANLRTTIIPIACSLLLASCSENPEPVEIELTPVQSITQVECKSDADLNVHCGYKNAEDLALTPDGEFLIMTGFSALPDTYISEMYLFDLERQARADLTITLADSTWGDAACQRDSLDFSPHGLSLRARADGVFQLAITNHHPEETIELFELAKSEASWGLVWRGCVTAPANTLLNDVALTQSGDFYTTEMYSADLPFEDLLAAGADESMTGHVWHWKGAEGFTKMAGTEGSFPNGIALSDDEEYLYINYWFAGKTTKFNLSTAKVEFEHRAGKADNLTNVNGDIWVAKHDISLDQLSECPPELAQCLLPFTIYNLSGEDLSEQGVYPFTSKIFGAATVAIPHEGQVWLGTFHGDRIASFDLLPNE